LPRQRVAEVRVRAARPGDAAGIAAMANALNLFEGKPPCPLTAAAVRRLGFGKRRGGRWIEWHAMVDNPAAVTFYECIGAKRAELWTFHLEGKALARFR
jgi:hypothetical protein